MEEQKTSLEARISVEKEVYWSALLLLMEEIGGSDVSPEAEHPILWFYAVLPVG
jgi:hypothetical protein